MSSPSRRGPAPFLAEHVPRELEAWHRRACLRSIDVQAMGTQQVEPGHAGLSIAWGASPLSASRRLARLRPLQCLAFILFVRYRRVVRSHLPPRLHQAMAADPKRLPAMQPGVGAGED